MKSIIEQELISLKQKSLYRELRVLENLERNHARLQGRDFLLFCSNDYLGLTKHPRVLDAAKKSLEEEGLGSGASRLISGTTGAHRALEEKLARFKGKEKALVFSSGYMANVGTLSTLAGKEDLIVMDKLCHASIIDGARLSGATVRVFPHLNYSRCEKILGGKEAFRQKILISETLFSMDGDLANVEELIRIKKKYDCLLVLDDAHGTGVLGRSGKGALEDGDLAREVDVIVGTLSKAIGCLGGFVVSSEKVVEYLINRSRPFIFATSLPAVLCRAAEEALQVIEEEQSLQERLRRNIGILKKEFTRLGYVFPKENTPILPLIIGREETALEFFEALYNQGIYVPAIRTPTVAKGEARLRVTVSAVHSETELEMFLKTFGALHAKA